MSTLLLNARSPTARTVEYNSEITYAPLLPGLMYGPMVMEGSS